MPSRMPLRCLLLLGIAVAAALEIGLAFLIGARIIHAWSVALPALLLPVAAMVAIAAGIGWVAHVDRRRQPPATVARWDELLRRPTPGTRYAHGRVSPVDVDATQLLPVVDPDQTQVLPIVRGSS